MQWAPDENGAARLPPHSREAERCVLGSMLRDNVVIGDVMQVVRRDNFYADAHQKVFEGIVHLYDKGQPVDLVVLAEWLAASKYIDDVGGYSYLGELWDAAPTAANVEYYAKIVRDKAIVRSLIHTGNEILRDAHDGVAAAEDLLEAAERKILDIAQMGMSDQTLTLFEALQEAYDRIDARANKEFTETGVLTGFVDMDEITAGLHNNELVLLAARPSVGKTALALNVLRNVILGHKHAPAVPAFFVSLEQSRTEIAERFLIAEARVDSHKLRKGFLSSEDMARLIDAGDKLRNAKLFIDDQPQQSMLRIAANARRLKKREDIRVVVIDYLQLIDPENKRDSRQEQVAQISRRLKFLARELHIPVVALAQVNRTSEDRQDHRPRLADLRESGSLEQDADTVMMLHRPGKYEGGLEDNVMELIIAKQRNGPTGEVTLTFRKDFMLFENHAFGNEYEASAPRYVVDSLRESIHSLPCLNCAIEDRIRPMIRIGSGHDTHRLELGRPLILGGVHLPHAHGPAAHSDGDVVLHAITDALLGALALGDIGELYPDTDSQWRGADSAVFLRGAMERVHAAGYRIGNLDITIFAQEPKLGGSKANIRASVARLLNVDESFISVKAKTGERVGHIGRCEAIGCQAVVCVTNDAGGDRS